MASRSKASAVGWLAALVALAACAGAATAAALLTGPPEDLKAAQEVSAAAVGHDSFDDVRTVQLSVAAAAPIHLFAPSSGRLTAFACEQGGIVRSGEAPLSIDGSPKLALATTAPLWRDLTVQSRGDDVRAVQDELTRLGFPVVSDGVFGQGTLIALKRLLRGIGAPVDGDTVPLASIIWIPEASTTIATCETSVGADVTSASSMATFASVSPRVNVVALPQNLVPGARVVQIGVATFPMQDNGEVKVSDLASLGITAPSDTGNSAAKPIDAQLALADPVAVSIVPPNAVYRIEGAEGCVSFGRAAYRVHLVGSQLGQSLVTFSGSPTPSRVDVPPRSDKPCA